MNQGPHKYNPKNEHLINSSYNYPYYYTMKSLLFGRFLARKKIGIHNIAKYKPSGGFVYGIVILIADLKIFWI